jgi:hypothetical protein
VQRLSDRELVVRNVGILRSVNELNELGMTQLEGVSVDGLDFLVAKHLEIVIVVGGLQIIATWLW